MINAYLIALVTVHVQTRVIFDHQAHIGDFGPCIVLSLTFARHSHTNFGILA